MDLLMQFRQSRIYRKELIAHIRQREDTLKVNPVPVQRVAGSIPVDIMNLADNVGKEYGVSGQQICDRYLQIRQMTEFDQEAIDDLVQNVLLDITGKEESWLCAFVEPIKAGVLTKPMKPEPEHNPTPEASELPQFTEAVSLIKKALKHGDYPHHFFVLYETKNELYIVINFADTARRSLGRPNDAKEQRLCRLLAWHLRNGWWR